MSEQPEGAALEEEEEREPLEVGQMNNKKRKRRGGNKLDPEVLTFKRKLDQCSRNNDWKEAYSLFKTQQDEKLAIPQHCYNTMLHLCTVVPSVNEGLAKESEGLEGDIYATAEQIFEAMQKEKIPPQESTFSAMAKVAAKTGKPDRAMEWVEEMKKYKLDPRLRSFTPVLMAYCDQGDLEKAFMVDKAIADLGLVIGETEYRCLLGVCMDTKRTEAAQEVLARMKKSLPFIEKETVPLIERWFNLAANPRPGSMGWETFQTEVTDEGLCSSSGDQLKAVDLTTEERDTLAAGIRKLALERESQEHFQAFMDWLDTHGPIKWLVDGANVGMYNQNFSDASFNFKQVDRLMSYMTSLVPVGQRPPLVVLHNRRVTTGPAKRPASKTILQQWGNHGLLYTTPNGSNDDWYWLYAAVVAGEHSYLVTNDELRDHIFQMLPDPKLFYRWKERHQVRFTITYSDGITCIFPLPYSRCIQELENGSWYFPIGDDTDEEEATKWLCARPVTNATTGRRL